MHNKKAYLLFVATVICIPTLQAKRSWPGIDFDSIEEFFERQIEQFNRMHAMQSRRRQPVQAVAIPSVTAKATIPLQTLTASIKENEQQVIIQLDGLDAQELDARVSDDNTVLTIYTPHERIEIEVQEDFIQVQTHQERSCQQDQGQFCSASASSVSQPVSGNPKLGTQTIEYDPSSFTLTITLPKQLAEKQGTSVPVNIKRANHTHNEK